MSSEIYAVVVADVMASSTRKDVRALLGKKLAAVSEKHLSQKLIRLPYSVTAGDEFQTITAELSSVPALLLDLRAALQPLPLRVASVSAALPIAFNRRSTGSRARRFNSRAGP